MEIEGKYCMMQYPLRQNQENDTEAADATELRDIDLPNIPDIFPQLSNRSLQDIIQYRKMQRYAHIISGQPMVSRYATTFINYHSPRKKIVIITGADGLTFTFRGMTVVSNDSLFES